MAEQRVQRRLAAILDADVVGYSAMMGRDEVGTLARLDECREQIIDPSLARHGGRNVKVMGDGGIRQRRGRRAVRARSLDRHGRAQ
ncbi:MAG: hypothetical protein VX741_15045 [Pseudomonadota bacterium]|nr:hypothetical protein [Pseudomonadota bacterium]